MGTHALRDRLSSFGSSCSRRSRCEVLGTECRLRHLPNPKQVFTPEVFPGHLELLAAAMATPTQTQRTAQPPRGTSPVPVAPTLCRRPSSCAPSPLHPRVMLSLVSARGVGHAGGRMGTEDTAMGEDRQSPRLAVGHHRCLWAVIPLPSRDSPTGRPSCSGDAPLTPRAGKGR